MTRRLRDIWRKLDHMEIAPPPAPPLGYRGSILDCGMQGRWHAFRGAIVSGELRRADPGREFERLLLESAPSGLIPAEILREVRRRS